jgi:hypothetical protein
MSSSGEPWPKLDDAARIGLVAEFLDVVELESESDPAGMLVDFLATFGNVVGVTPKMHVQADVHRPVVNVVAVGRTSRGRKGTGRAFVRRVFAAADSQWHERCVVSGYASGEGIIADLADDNADDPRRLVEEVEFSRVLRVAGREGSILSETLRRLWDGLPVSNRKSLERITVERHHFSIVGNITQEELDDALSRTEAVNGFANRFLWPLTERARKLPHGGNLGDDDFRRLGARVKGAIAAARKVGTMRRSPDADRVWEEWYMTVPDRPGLWGAATARAEAQVLRLSMIYALTDGGATIERRHVEAAIAVWDYCDGSARIIFGTRSGNRDVDKLVDALRAAGTLGLDRTQQHKLFKHHQRQAAGARERVIQLGLGVEFAEPGGRGRPRQVLYLNELAPVVGAVS